MGVGGQRHAPAALPPGKTRYQLHRRLGGLMTDLDWCGKSRLPPGFDPQNPTGVRNCYVCYLDARMWFYAPPLLSQ